MWKTITNINLGEGMEDFVYLSPSKDLRLSKGFILKNKIKQEAYKFLVFYFDPAKNKLALSFKKQEAKESFKISFDNRPGKESAKISCNGMFNAFNFDPARLAGRYFYTKITDQKLGDLYIIDINEGQKNGK